MSRRLPVIVLVLASVYFIARGPVRFLDREKWSDATISYCNARGWISGLNPYLTETIQRVWHHGGASRDTLEGSFSLPPSVPIFTMVAWLPWAECRFLLVTFGSAILILAILRLIQHFGIRDNNRYYFAAFVLGLAPFGTAFAVGNVSSFLIPIIVLCWLYEEQRNTSRASVLLGLGLCFKPQLFVPVVVYFALNRNRNLSARLRVIGVSLLLVLVSTALFVAVSVPGWWQAFQVRLHAMGSGDPNDFALSNEARYQLLNFQIIPASFGVDRMVCNLLAFALAVVLFVFWLRSNRALAPLMLISFFPWYHRFYEAGILMLVLAASFAFEDRLLRWLCVPFLIPLPTVLYNYVPIHNLWWNVIVLSHEIWLILLITILYLVRYGATLQSTGDDREWDNHQVRATATG